jgi:hypothetical protein
MDRLGRFTGTPAMPAPEAPAPYRDDSLWTVQSGSRTTPLHDGGDLPHRYTVSQHLKACQPQRLLAPLVWGQEGVGQLPSRRCGTCRTRGLPRVVRVRGRLPFQYPYVSCGTRKAVLQSAPLPDAYHLVSLPLALLLRQQKTVLVMCPLWPLYGV